MTRLAWLVLVAGCATSEPAPAPIAIEPVPVAVEAPATAMAFTNAKGELVCPVMGDVIPSPDKASSQLEHAGKTYYFCCNSCEEAFKADPEHYADGSYLVSIGKWESSDPHSPGACE